MWILYCDLQKQKGACSMTANSLNNFCQLAMQYGLLQQDAACNSPDCLYSVVHGIAPQAIDDGRTPSHMRPQSG